MPGVERRTAEVIVAECGTDMSRFPTPGHLASWAGQCPSNEQSAGRRRSGRTRKGSKWLDMALEDPGLAATRSKDTHLRAQYDRVRPRRGHGRALGAVKHSMLVACWHMLQTGELYRDLGGDTSLAGGGRERDLSAWAVRRQRGRSGRMDGRLVRVLGRGG
jgi:transposase